MKADLHIHSKYSDGALSPEEIAEIAAANGVEIASLTDHDGAAGSEEFSVCASARGIKTVSGIEVSAYDGDTKIHTLAYGFDRSGDVFGKFAAELRDNSFKRAEDIIFKLGKCGVNLSLEECAAERFGSETPVHAIHICRAAVKKGYGRSEFTFYETYLSNPKKPAYSNILRPSPEYAAEVMTAAGGFVSLAHPLRITLSYSEIEEIVKRMMPCGLKGIEAVYSAHTDYQTAYLTALAGKYGLLVTGGSDLHITGKFKNIGSPEFHPSAGLMKRLFK